VLFFLLRARGALGAYTKTSAVAPKSTPMFYVIGFFILNGRVISSADAWPGVDLCGPAGLI
jgi:hypothetical protein